MIRHVCILLPPKLAPNLIQPLKREVVRFHSVLVVGFERERIGLVNSKFFPPN